MNIIDDLIFSKTALNLGSYEILDADWKDEYGLLVILKEERHFFVLINDGNSLSPPIQLEYPFVRWIDKDKILLANPNNGIDIDNVFILDLNGNIINSFNGGDGIEDIEVSEEGLWVSYFDEGVFGQGISTEGLVLVDWTGNVIFRYHTDFIGGPPIDDCYAICKGQGTSIWLFPYYDFPLLHISPDLKTMNSYKVPKKLYGSNAICIRGKYAYFFSGYDSKNELCCWEIGKKKPQTLGKIDGIMRGLRDGQRNHFISVSEENVTLYRVMNEDE